MPKGGVRNANNVTPSTTLPPNAVTCRKMRDMLRGTARWPFGRDHIPNWNLVQARVPTAKVIRGRPANGAPFPIRHDAHRGATKNANGTSIRGLSQMLI